MPNLTRSRYQLCGGWEMGLLGLLGLLGIDMQGLSQICLQQIGYWSMRSVKVGWMAMVLILLVAMAMATSVKPEETPQTPTNTSEFEKAYKEAKDAGESVEILTNAVKEKNIENKNKADEEIDSIAEVLEWIAKSVISIFPTLSGSLSSLVATIYQNKQLMAGILGTIYTVFQMVFGGGVSYLTSKMKNLNVHKEMIEQGFDLQFRIFQKQEMKVGKAISVSPAFEDLFQFLNIKDNKEVKLILGSTGIGFSTNINEWTRGLKAKDRSLRHIFYDMAEPPIRYNNASDNTHMECIKAIVYSLLHRQDRNFVLLLFKGIIEKVFQFCIKIIRLIETHIPFFILYLSFVFYLRQIFYLITIYVITYMLILPVGYFTLQTVWDFLCLLKNILEQKSPKQKSTNMKLIIDNFQVLRAEYEDRFHAGKLKHISQGAATHASLDNSATAPDSSTFEQHKKVFIQNLTGFFNNVTALLDSGQQDKTEVIIIVRNSEFYRQYMELLRLNSANPFKIKKFSQLPSEDIDYILKQRTFKDVMLFKQQQPSQPQDVQDSSKSKLPKSDPLVQGKKFAQGKLPPAPDTFLGKIKQTLIDIKDGLILMWKSLIAFPSTIVSCLFNISKKIGIFFQNSLKVIKSIFAWLLDLLYDMAGFRKEKKDPEGVEGIKITKYLQLFHNNSKEIMKLLREVELDKKYCEDSGSPMTDLEPKKEEGQEPDQENNKPESGNNGQNKDKQKGSKQQKKVQKRYKTERENIAQVIRHSMAQIIKHAELLNQLASIQPSNLDKDQQDKTKDKQTQQSKPQKHENHQKDAKDQSETKKKEYYKNKESLRYIGLFLGCIHKQLIFFANRRQTNQKRLQDIYEELIEHINQVDLDMLSTISTNNRHYLFERYNGRFQMKEDAKYLILKWDELIKYIKGDNNWTDTLQRDFVYYYTENLRFSGKLNTISHKEYHAQLNKDEANFPEDLIKILSKYKEASPKTAVRLSKVKDASTNTEQVNNENQGQKLYEQQIKDDVATDKQQLDAQARKIFADIVDFLTEKEIISQHIFFSRSMALANYYFQQKLKEKLLYQTFQIKKCKLGTTIKRLNDMRTGSEQNKQYFREFCKIIGQVRTRFQYYVRHEARTYEEGMDWLKWYYLSIPKCSISELAIDSASKYLIFHSNNTFILRPFPNQVFLYWGSFSLRLEEILKKHADQDSLKKLKKQKVDLLRSKTTLCAFEYFEAMEYERTHTFNLLECQCANITHEIENMQRLEDAICKRAGEKQSKSNKFSRVLNMAYEQLIKATVLTGQKKQDKNDKQGNKRIKEQEAREIPKGEVKNKQKTKNKKIKQEKNSFSQSIKKKEVRELPKGEVKEEARNILKGKDQVDHPKEKILAFLEQQKHDLTIKDLIKGSEFKQVEQYLTTYEFLLKQYHPEGLFKELSINYRKNLYVFKNGRSFFLSKAFKSLIFAYHLMLKKNRQANNLLNLYQKKALVQELVQELINCDYQQFFSKLDQSKRLAFFSNGDIIASRLQNALIQKIASLNAQLKHNIGKENVKIQQQFKQKITQLDKLLKDVQKQQENSRQEKKKILTEHIKRQKERLADCEEREKYLSRTKLKHQNQQKKALACVDLNFKKVLLLSDIKTQLAAFCYLS